MAPSVFDKYRIVLLVSEGCLNRDHVDLLLLNPASAAGIYPIQGIYCSSNVARDVETWEVFLYPINIFVITSRCKGNLVETIFATHIIKM
jgi:hypothetical protein